MWVKLKESILVKEAKKAGNLDKVVEHEMIMKEGLNSSFLQGMILGGALATASALTGILIAKNANK